MAVPLLPPQVAGVVDVLAVSTGGCVMLNVCVVVQPFASVTVTVYVPEHKAEAVAPVPPDGAHE